MPRTAEQFQEMREESEDRIVAAALELFARHGFESTSVRMIARRAGVSQGLLYNYFEGKDGLLRAVFERGMADVERSFAESAAGRTPAERLEQLVRSALRIVDEHRPFWRLSYQLRMQPEVVARLGEDLLAWTNLIRARIGDSLREAGEPRAEIAALALFAAIDGAAQHFVLDPDAYPIEEVCGAIADRFVRRAPLAKETEHEHA